MINFGIRSTLKSRLAPRFSGGVPALNFSYKFVKLSEAQSAPPQLVSEFEALVREYKPGQPLKFDLAVDVPPEIQLKEYTGLTIKVEEVKYDPATVDGILEEQRHKQATLIPVEDRPAPLPAGKSRALLGSIIRPDGKADSRQGQQVIPDTDKHGLQTEESCAENQEERQQEEAQPHIDVGKPFDPFADTRKRG